jgi:hypothetical protein
MYCHVGGPTDVYKLHLFKVIVHTDTCYLQKDLVLQTVKASLM